MNRVEMVAVPAGSFMMGATDPEGGPDEQPLHRVEVPAFWLGRTAVTQAQWLGVMGSNPSYFLGNSLDCPVENVSWAEAQAFLVRLNAMTGRAYRLPSEAEWEDAARAGSHGKWAVGNDNALLAEYSWYNANSDGKTHPVAGKKPNAFGLYDMHGNVWEWVEDRWHDTYEGAPTDGSAWTCGEHARRVLRGGGWVDCPGGQRSAERNSHLRVAPGYRGGDTGLRVASNT